MWSQQVAKTRESDGQTIAKRWPKDDQKMAKWFWNNRSVLICLSRPNLKYQRLKHGIIVREPYGNVRMHVGVGRHNTDRPTRRPTNRATDRTDPSTDPSTDQPIHCITDQSNYLLTDKTANRPQSARLKPVCGQWESIWALRLKYAYCL